MKTRILATIITGVLVTSAAQADSAFSTNDLDVIYSGLNPSFTRNVDITGYYTAPAQLQQAAASDLVTSVAQADSISPIDVIYSGLNPSVTRDLDVTGYYTTPPQLQDISSYYTTPQQQKQAAHDLATSVAQASSTSPIDVIYSGLNPSVTRDLDVTGYYTAPAQLQQAAHKSACNWSVAKNDLNLLKAAYTVAGNTEYFAPTNLQLVC